MGRVQLLFVRLRANRLRQVLLHGGLREQQGHNPHKFQRDLQQDALNTDSEPAVRGPGQHARDLQREDPGPAHPSQPAGPRRAQGQREQGGRGLRRGSQQAGLLQLQRN